MVTKEFAKRTPTTQPIRTTGTTKVPFPLTQMIKSTIFGFFTLLLAFNLLVMSHSLPTNTTTQQKAANFARIRRNFILSLSRNPVDRNPSNMLHIGEVPLDGYPHCAEWFSEYRSKCQAVYEGSLNRAILAQKRHHEQVYGTSREKSSGKKFFVSEDSDWMKKSKCCGMWTARDCLVGLIEGNMSHAVKDNLCPLDLTSRFRRLPTDEQERADVLDYCSEYAEGSPICRDFALNSSGTSARSLPLPLYLYSTLFTIIATLVTRLENLL